MADENAAISPSCHLPWYCLSASPATLIHIGLQVDSHQQVWCADALGFSAGVRPAAEILSFASPKESIQRKGDPTFAPSATLRVPCASHLKRRLRNSRWPCRPALRQSSPTTPFQPAMLGALDGSPLVVAPTIFDWIGVVFLGACPAIQSFGSAALAPAKPAKR